MASEAATPETTATATVLRATERQIRLRLGKAHGDREVTKRVAVPADIREQVEGAKVPVVITGTGDKAKVELAEDWASAVTAKKPAARKAPAKKAAATKPAAKKPAAKQTSAEKPAATKPAAKKPAAKKAPAEKPAAEPTAESETSTAAAAETAPGEATTDAPKRRRGRGGASGSRSRAKQGTESAAPSAPAVSPAVIAERIAAAVELVRDARR